MNILHVRASNFYGGPERQLHFHAREAEGSAHRVIIASFLEEGEEPAFITRIREDGLPTHCFDVRSAYDTSQVRQIRRYLREQEIDILCSHDHRSTVLGWLAARNDPARWIAFSRGFTLTNAKVRLYQTAEKLLTRRAAHVVAVSEAQKQKLRKLFIKDEHITVARNAIDVETLRAVPAVDLRERFGFAEDDLIFVAAGRFSIEKCQEMIIRATAKLLPRLPHLRFILFGMGFELEKMRALTRRLGVDSQVLCPGFEHDMLGCLKGADALINASSTEGLPNIVLEALAFEIPIVATAVGGVPEIVEDGRTGTLIPPLDEASLMRAIEATAGNMERARSMARAGLEFARRECTFARQFEVLSSVYERVGA